MQLAVTTAASAGKKASKTALRMCHRTGRASRLPSLQLKTLFALIVLTISRHTFAFRSSLRWPQRRPLPAESSLVHFKNPRSLR